MQPNRVGRVLGIGTRIAAEKLRERAGLMGQPAGSSATGRKAEAGAPGFAGAGVASPPRATGAANRVPAAGAGDALAGGGRRLARGAGRFGAAMLQPVTRAGGILVLQISGVFFSLFAVFFLSHTWQTWRAAGWRDRHTEMYAGMMLLFGWFAISSFWRAKRKERGR